LSSERQKLQQIFTSIYSKVRSIQNNSLFAVKDFEQWNRESATKATEKYLTWIGDRVKYKTIYVAGGKNEEFYYMIGCTEYKVKRVLDVMSKFNNTIDNFEAAQLTEDTIRLSRFCKERGIIFAGEPATPSPDGTAPESPEMALDNLIMVGAEVYQHIGIPKNAGARVCFDAWYRNGYYGCRAAILQIDTNVLKRHL